MLTNVAETINAMRPLILLTVLSALMLTGCSHYKFPWVYRINVEQGNIVDEEKLAQLKVGMTQKQVRYLLGSPLIQDTFNPSRWDYFYSYRTGKGQYDRSRITLQFDGDQLASIDKKEYETRKLNY